MSKTVRTLSDLLEMEDDKKQQELLIELISKSNVNFKTYLKEI